MTIKDDNQQISAVLPKKYVEKLDLLAEYELRTRSKQAAKILIEYLRNYDFEKMEPNKK